MRRDFPRELRRVGFDFENIFCRNISPKIWLDRAVIFFYQNLIAQIQSVRESAADDDRPRIQNPERRFPRRREFPAPDFFRKCRRRGRDPGHPRNQIQPDALRRQNFFRGSGNFKNDFADSNFRTVFFRGQNSDAFFSPKKFDFRRARQNSRGFRDDPRADFAPRIRQKFRGRVAAREGRSRTKIRAARRRISGTRGSANSISRFVFRIISLQKLLDKNFIPVEPESQFSIIFADADAGDHPQFRESVFARDSLRRGN